ncbi:hypothetical protein GCM10023193_08900 [Planotetraspora kaengkrachanensis]|uniref:Uncharacterized protein n=1 Tax=Planotetraspora kaengkrachanensis TaxID=575193 RepID=A0A8J3M1J4_9ACTN|nr:hypothetical protein Pka01_07910 [Planotetraspora kaengkrachanensis]
MEWALAVPDNASGDRATATAVIAPIVPLLRRERILAPRDVAGEPRKNAHVARNVFTNTADWKIAAYICWITDLEHAAPQTRQEFRMPVSVRISGLAGVNMEWRSPEK